MTNDLRQWLFEHPLFLAIILIVFQASVLILLGQPATCACGGIKLWEGVVLSSGNSQHLTDWYTFSHLVHGFLFYLLLWFLFPRLPITQRFLLAVGLEVSWEILENTPWAINHYREQALAQGYVGDSVLNSVSDTFSMMIGFSLAWLLPVWASVLAVLGLEISTAVLIRDNLTLNIIGFIHQFDFITRWQTK